MSLKWLKYAIKRQVIGAAPGVYWGVRQKVRGPVEPEIALLRHLCRSERAALDIGANWGAYSYVASKFASAVHCFEPQAELARVLTRGVGRLPNVFVHNLALSKVSGWTEMRIPKNDIGYSTIEPENRLEDKADLRRGINVVRVRTERLDDLALGSPIGFIKIDVEGHELEVLEGGLELIARDTPSLIVEVEERHRSGSVEAVQRLLGGLDYSIFTLRANQLAALGQKQTDASGSSRNLVFVHPKIRRELPEQLFALG